MALRESHLPGIGRKYVLDVRNRNRIVTVVHNTGRRDLYVYGSTGADPRCQVELDDDDARRLGAILGGAYFRPAVAEGVEQVLGRLVIDWVALDESSPAVGKTILELEVRTVTGMTVIGIVRGDTPMTNPAPDTRLLAGDRVVVVGPVNGMDDLIEFLTG